MERAHNELGLKVLGLSPKIGEINSAGRNKNFSTLRLGFRRKTSYSASPTIESLLRSASKHVAHGTLLVWHKTAVRAIHPERTAEPFVCISTLRFAPPQFRRSA